MQSLPSYLEGRWADGAGEPAILVNPSTEEPVAAIRAAGSLAGAVAFARERGGPVLRGLSFAERGQLLLGLSRVIHQSRDELIELALRNAGNTRSDAKFDIDGAIGALVHYGELGTKLGTARVLFDGEHDQVGRSPRLVGRHVMVPRMGVAVFVNAFNFPAWGFAEKAACAFLAGVPVLVKPATSSALLAHRIVELLVEKKTLPDGALSLLAGSPRDLLAHLGAQDVLAFTGSGGTAEAIRALPNVIRHSVRVNVEADSLNAAVLGPEVEAGSDMYETFLKDVVRDMTQKAGQKCTAIRRILVSPEAIESVRRDLSELLSAVTVGDPADEATRMGPVATASQRDEARAGIDGLVREGKKVFAQDALPAKGWFVGPTLVEAAPEARAVHEREVFGPVATLIPYEGNPGPLIARGNGGLVSSIYSEDQAFIESAVLEMAPHNGRLFLGHPKIELSPGPGTVLPQLVHGGPGRAGGGEELGGPRGLAFYMQRTALQGSRPVIQKLTGTKEG